MKLLMHCMMREKVSLIFYNNFIYWMNKDLDEIK